MADFNNGGGYNATYFRPSTDGLAMFNDNMMLKIAYYDTYMKFELREKNMEGKFPTPETGKDISVLLSAEKAAAFMLMLDEFEEKIISYNNDFADGKDCSGYKPFSIAIHVGSTPEKTRVLQISTGTAIEGQGFVPVVLIHVGVDSTLAATKTYAFQTKTCPCLVDYESTSGSFELVHKLGQYEVIALAIRGFAYASSRAVSHFNKTLINDERLKTMEKVVNLLAEHFNIQVPDSNSSGNKFRATSPFESFVSNTPQQPPVIENGGDLGTLLGIPNT